MSSNASCHCGRFAKPLPDKETTGFLLDGATATSIPHAPFACWNPRHHIGTLKTGAVTLHPVAWRLANE